MSSWLRTIIFVSVTFNCPVLAVAQTKRIPTIGYLAPALPCVQGVSSMDAFRQGLREAGYVENESILIRCRSAEGKPARLSELARELVESHVDVIIAGGGELVARAAQQVSASVPIVVTNAAGPVRTGLVKSLSKPGGNVTGLVTISPELSAKRLELLRETLPRLSTVAILSNPANPEHGPRLTEVSNAARKMSLQMRVYEVRSGVEIADAFAAMAKARVDAVLPLGDPLIVSEARQIVALAEKYRLPAMYHRGEFIEAGGLMSYGPSYDDLFRRAAGYAVRIIKGATPAEMPLEQPTKFELLINLKSAKELRLTIPSAVLARAERIVN